ncbi:ABC transporter substrate-binding protein [Arthrobacter sp. AOP36-A1-22]|uniref:ABC transporter substrate-binding protein n=1 Tax=unclassified Arthrobacter TaxID=235627 RepID=UPI004034C0D4
MESTNRPGDAPGPGTSLPAGGRPSRRTVLGIGSIAMAGLVGCTKATTPEELPTAAPPSRSIVKNLEIRFGTPASPAILDPALASDNESFRVTRQIFESLISVDPDTGAPTPGLATKWTTSKDGLTYTFTLRDGVSFHDGTEFNADAVVHNFERWANLPKDLGGQVGQAFESVFHHNDVQLAHDKSIAPDTRAATQSALRSPDVLGGLGLDKDPGKEPAPEDPIKTVTASYYQGCRAEGTHTFVLTLTKPITGLIDALTLPGFGIASPSALRKYKADESTKDSSGGISTGFSKHPVGTGPYLFDEAAEDSVTVIANEDHWRHSTQIGRATFAVLRDPSSRLQSLRRQKIAAYDMVTVGELRELVREGQQVLQRDPFSILYMGMNQSNPVLADRKIRQAVAHAVDRQKLIEEFFISGTKEARSFVPPSLGVPDAQTYFGYDLPKAKSLLKSSDYDGEPIPFTYPLNVTRAYLPMPERIYAALSAQLTAAGFNIKPYPVEWEDGYLEDVVSGHRPGFHLSGWNGGYRDPDNFIGTLFGTTSPEFDYDAPKVRAKIVKARSMPNGDQRATTYQQIGEQLAKDLPALPLAYPISAVAADDTVLHYPTSPTLDEPFDRVRLAT